MVEKIQSKQKDKRLLSQQQEYNLLQNHIVKVIIASQPFQFDQKHLANTQNIFSGFLVKKDLIMLPLFHQYNSNVLKQLKAMLVLPSGEEKIIAMNNSHQVIIKQIDNRKGVTFVYIRIDGEEECNLEFNKTNQIINIHKDNKPLDNYNQIEPQSCQKWPLDLLIGNIKAEIKQLSSKMIQLYIDVYREAQYLDKKIIWKNYILAQTILNGIARYFSFTMQCIQSQIIEMNQHIQQSNQTFTEYYNQLNIQLGKYNQQMDNQHKQFNYSIRLTKIQMAKIFRKRRIQIISIMLKHLQKMKQILIELFQQSDLYDQGISMLLLLQRVKYELREKKKYIVWNIFCANNLQLKKQINQIHKNSSQNIKQFQQNREQKDCKIIKNKIQDIQQINQNQCLQQLIKIKKKKEEKKVNIQDQAWFQFNNEISSQQKKSWIRPICSQIIQKIILDIQKKLCSKHIKFLNYYYCQSQYFQKDRHICNLCIKTNDHNNHYIFCKRCNQHIQYTSYDISQIQQKIAESIQQQLYLCQSCSASKTYRLNLCHHQPIEKICFQFDQQKQFQSNQLSIYQCPKCFKKKYQQNSTCKILEMNQQSQQKLKQSLKDKYCQQIKVQIFQLQLSNLRNKLLLKPTSKIIELYSQKCWFIQSYIEIYQLSNPQKINKIVNDAFSSPNKHNLFKLWLIQNRQFSRFNDQKKHNFLQFFNDKVIGLIQQFDSTIKNGINNYIQKIFELILNEDESIVQQYLNQKYYKIINKKNKPKYIKSKIQGNDQYKDNLPPQIFEISPENFYTISEINMKRVHHLLIEKDIQQFGQHQRARAIKNYKNQFQNHFNQYQQLIQKQDFFQFSKLFIREGVQIQIKLYKSDQQKKDLQKRNRQMNQQYLSIKKGLLFQNYLQCKDQKWFQNQKPFIWFLFSQNLINQDRQNLTKNLSNQFQSENKQYQRYICYKKTIQLIKQRHKYIKQWSQQLKQSKIFKKIMDTKIECLLTLTIKYNHYYHPYGQLQYNYQLSSFDLFKVINLNKQLKQCQIQGIHIKHFQELINFIRIYQKQNVDIQKDTFFANKPQWLTVIQQFGIKNQLKLSIPGALVKIEMTSILKNESAMKNFKLIHEILPGIRNINVLIQLSNYFKELKEIMKQSVELMCKLQSIYIFIYNKNTEFLKQIKDEEPILILLKQLVYLKNIKGFKFKCKKFCKIDWTFDLNLSQICKNKLKSIFTIIDDNNQIQHFLIRNQFMIKERCRKFPVLPKFKRKSLKILDFVQKIGSIDDQNLQNTIQKLTQMEVLALSQKGQTLQVNLKPFHKLKQLFLQKKSVNNFCVSSLSQQACFNLQILHLQIYEHDAKGEKQDITKSLKIILPKLYNLSKLVFCNIQFDTSSIINIPSIYLTNISFSNCQNITDEFLLEIDVKWPYIKQLTLRSCSNVYGRFIKNNTFKELTIFKSFKNKFRFGIQQKFQLQLRGVIIVQTFVYQP